jgi:hypothetical protein
VSEKVGIETDCVCAVVCGKVPCPPAQSDNFVKRNSGEERVEPDCKVEEACTTDIVGAAIAGLSGLTTSEKLEKMGRDGDAINGGAVHVDSPRPVA